MPGTRVWPLAGPSVNFVPGIPVLKRDPPESRGWHRNAGLPEFRNYRCASRINPTRVTIGERSDAVLRTAMPGHGDVESPSAKKARRGKPGGTPANPLKTHCSHAPRKGGA